MTMTPDLRQKIIHELLDLLNRKPFEHEIINAQSDQLVMGRIRDKDIADLKTKQAQHAKDIDDMKKKIKP